MKQKLIHICPFDRNIGDNALNLAIDRMLAPAFDIGHMELVGNPFDRSAFEELSACDVILFGGGGVIHSCSGGASRINRERTGTMWNMELELISQLKPKIVLYSTGFNRFSGEPAPLDKMGEFFDVLNEKRALVSFRNDLSRDRYLKFFPRHAGIQVTPDPGMFLRDETTKIRGDYALIQIAVDRLDYRYPSGIDDFLSLVAELRALSPVPLFIVPHTAADLKLYQTWIDKLPVDGVVKDLTPVADTDLAMRLYRNALFTISTRGHSQICSVGNGTPTFALCTHPKAKGFMIEVGQEEASFDYLTEDRGVCIGRFKNFLSSLSSIRTSLSDYLVRANAEIAAFNDQIIDFAYNDVTPDPILTNPGATPKEMPASLEEERREAAEAGVQGEARPAQKELGYLPGQSEALPPGTYPFNVSPPRKDAFPPVLASASKSKRNLFGGKRVKRSSDGATCGIVISCDANYYPGVFTCLAAIRRYNPEIPVTFLDAGLTSSQVEDVKKRVDEFRTIPTLERLSVESFPSHLSKAALSSLFCHEASYDKILYLDIDALVLGDLMPMFEALDGNVDLAGVRGNNFGWLSHGKRHTVDLEISPDALDLLKARFPRIDYGRPAINSGCFSIWSTASRNWLGDAFEILPHLDQMRTSDQAIINLLISIRELRLKLMPRRYNSMGFQLTKRRNLVQLLGAEVKLSEDECALYLNGERLIVAHFAGAAKPWTASIQEAPSFAWDWHAAQNLEERREVIFRDRIKSCHSATEFEQAVAAYVETLSENKRFECLLAMGNEALDRSFFQLSHKYFRAAQKLRPTSPAAGRGRVHVSRFVGDVLTAREALKENTTLQEKGGGRVKRFLEATLPAVEGQGRAVSNDWVKSDGVAMYKLRQAAREGNQWARNDVPGFDAEAPRLNIEYNLLRSAAKGTDPARAAATALWRYERQGGILNRRAVNEAYRKTSHRLEILDADLSETNGKIGQVGAGHGTFLEALAHRTGQNIVSIGTGAEAPGLASAVPTVAPKDAEIGQLGLLVLANVLDRSNDPMGTLQAYLNFVSPGGQVLLIDAATKDPQIDLREGLGLLPPIQPLPSIQSLEELPNVAVSKVYLVSGERMVLLTLGTGHTPRPLADDTLTELEVSAQVLREAQSIADDPKVRDALEQEVRAQEFSPNTVLEALLSDDGMLEVDGVPPEPRVRLKDTEPSDDRPTDAADPRRLTKRCHIAYWSSRNAGDIFLTHLTQDLFGKHFPDLQVSRQGIGKNARQNLNDTDTLFVVGGGGLFHSTSGPNGFTQWNIRPEDIDAIRFPLVFFGVGLNEFRGTDFYISDLFVTNIRKLVSKSLLFGVRERRSCDMIRALVPGALAERVRFQPCPSLILPELHAPVLLPRLPKGKMPRHVFVNAAFDRPDMRFGGRLRTALEILSRLVEQLLADGHKVSVVAHNPEDALLHTALSVRDQVGLVALQGRAPVQTMVAYNEADLVIGMRTHSQDIPFGMGIPVISIVSHDKMAWVMEDLGMPECGIDLFDTEFHAKTNALVRSIFDNYENAKIRIRNEQLKLQAITAMNFEYLKASLD